MKHKGNAARLRGCAKRLTALVLSLCMLWTLAPAAFAAWTTIGAGAYVSFTTLMAGDALVATAQGEIWWVGTTVNPNGTGWAFGSDHSFHITDDVIWNCTLNKQKGALHAESLGGTPLRVEVAKGKTLTLESDTYGIYTLSTNYKEPDQQLNLELSGEGDLISNSPFRGDSTSTVKIADTLHVIVNAPSGSAAINVDFASDQSNKYYWRTSASGAWTDGAKTPAGGAQKNSAYFEFVGKNHLTYVQNADHKTHRRVCADSCSSPATIIASQACTFREDQENYDKDNLKCTVCGGYDTPELKNGAYQITNANQLYWFAALVNGKLDGVAQNKSANAVLMNDIDVHPHFNVLDEKGKLIDDANWICRQWVPIGNVNYYDSGYTGTFDGQNHTISGLYVNDENGWYRYVGLFGTLSSGCKIANLGLKDSYFRGNHSDGAVGSIAGRASADSGDITITNCYNMSYVRHDGTSAGGLVGSTGKGTKISNCYHAGTVDLGRAITYAGGEITNCYYLAGSADKEDNRATSKTAAEFKSGEVAYLLQAGNKTEGVWGQTLNADAYPVLGGKKVYRNEIYASCTKEADKLTYVYANSYADPIYNGEHAYGADGFCTVCGAYQPAEKNASGAYAIGNAGQLYWFAALVNNDNANYASANAVLTADITVNENVLDESGSLSSDSGKFRTWKPIGSCVGNVSKSYTGTFDGQNHTISGLCANKDPDKYVGMFGQLANGCKIMNLGLEDSFFVGALPVGSVGSIAGHANGDVTITNCYNMSTVNYGMYYAGGILGSSTEYGLKISNCYHAGLIVPMDKSGAIVGNGVNNSTTNCYYLADKETAETNGVTGKTAAQFKSGEVAYLLQAGNKTEAVWGQTIGTDAYPVLGGEKKVYRNEAYGGCQIGKGDVTYSYSNTEKDPTFAGQHVYENGFCKYCDRFEEATKNASGAYEIDNAGKLYWFAALVNGKLDGVEQNKEANAVLTADIVVNQNVLNENGDLNSGSFRAWVPIGQVIMGNGQYSGSFDGQNHSISGLYEIGYTNGEEHFDYYIGLFGHVFGGLVSNVTVLDSYFKGSEKMGGIAGAASSATIQNCHSAATIKSESWMIGGIVGNNSGTIANCYNTGVVSSDSSQIGGIVGMNSKTVENCYNTGAVSGYRKVGGIVGANNVTVANCYNTGTVTGSSEVGEIVGENDETYGTVQNSYYLADSETDDFDGTTFKTADQFKSGEVAYLLQKENKTKDVWGQTIGTEGYPVLGGETVCQQRTWNVCENAAKNEDASYTVAYTNENKSDVYAPHTDNGKNYCIYCNAANPADLNLGAAYKGNSISLSGEIVINFHVALTDEAVKNEPSMQFTMNGEVIGTAAFNEDSYDETTKCYLYSCGVAAKEMTETVTAQMIDGDLTGTPHDYSVKQYADTIIENQDNAYSDAAVTLVKSMLNYGAYAQRYFDYNMDNLADADLSYDMYRVKAEELKDYEPVITGDTSVCTFDSAYLSLRSDTVLYVYVTLPDGVNPDDISFQNDGIETTPDPVEQDGKTYYVMGNLHVDACDLDRNVIIHAKNTTTQQSILLKYSPLSYCYTVLNDPTSDKKLVNIVQALYDYYDKAVKYQHDGIDDGGAED